MADNPFENIVSNTSQSSNASGYDENPFEKIVSTPSNQSFENLLSSAAKVVRQSRIGPMGGTSITAAVPTNQNEASDLARVFGRVAPGFAGLNTRGGDVNMTTMGPVGVGLNMMGINKTPALVSPPLTQYGKNLEMTTDVAPYAALGLEGATALSKPINRGLSSFFKAVKGEGIPQNEAIANRTNELINQTSNEAQGLKSQLENTKDQLSNVNAKESAHEKLNSQNLSTKAKDDINQIVSSKFEEARKNWSAMRETLDPSQVNRKDLVDTLDKVIKEKGIDASNPNLPTEERKLLDLRSRMNASIPRPTETGILDASGKPILKTEAPQATDDALQLKQFSDDAFNAVKGRSDLEGSFLYHFDNTLRSKGINDFQDANLKYQDAYQASQAAKELKSTLYAKAAKGELGPELSKKILDAEGKVGTKQLQKIIQDHLERSQQYATEKNSIYDSRKNIQSKYDEANQSIVKMKDRLKSVNDLISSMKKKSYIARGALGVGALGVAKALGVPGTEHIKRIAESGVIGV